MSIWTTAMRRVTAQGYGFRTTCSLHTEQVVTIRYDPSTGTHDVVNEWEDFWDGLGLDGDGDEDSEGGGSDVEGDDDGDGKGEGLVEYQARECPCTWQIQSTTPTPFYCPYPSTDMCGVSGRAQYVGCFAYSRQVHFSRNVWPVLLVLYSILLTALCTTRVGRNAAAFPLSRCCCRGYNDRIVDRRMDEYRARRDRRLRAWDAELRRRLAEEGHVVEYVLKTKRYGAEDKSDDGGGKGESDGNSSGEVEDKEKVDEQDGGGGGGEGNCFVGGGGKDVEEGGIDSKLRATPGKGAADNGDMEADRAYDVGNDEEVALEDGFSDEESARSSFAGSVQSRFSDDNLAASTAQPRQAAEAAAADSTHSHVSVSDAPASSSSVASRSPSLLSIHTEDENACTICILPLVAGDRVGDLECGHNFHVECLKPWIRRRNACPLCNAGRIAEERREFGNEDGGGETAGRDGDGGGGGGSVDSIDDGVDSVESALDEAYYGRYGMAVPGRRSPQSARGNTEAAQRGRAAAALARAHRGGRDAVWWLLRGSGGGSDRRGPQGLAALASTSLTAPH